VGEPVVGPSFLRFRVTPDRGIKVKDITNKDEELQVHLHLEQPPLIHNNHGEIVIDVKREQPEPVLFASIEQQLLSIDARRGSARIPLGVDLTGRLHLADISQNACPHILVAGTAGSGKSEWLRTAIAGLLRTNTPATLQLVLIDPKYNAFGDLEGSPFLFGGWPVLHPRERSVADALDVLIEKMDDRSRRFKEVRCDDLAGYVMKTGEAVPRIVCICDEYADLIADKADRKEIEPRIARLGGKARASGIHLIIATQYPKAVVVTSVIKANMSGRVCLRVTDARQSQVVLGRTGAERLLGNGDLFFLDIGDPVRLQSAYLPAAGRARVFGRN